MRGIIGVPALLALLGIMLPNNIGVSSEALEIVFFDVGQGDCAVLITPSPDQNVIVIDGGFSGTARSSVVPYLRNRNIQTINLMILTHPDQDHTNGLKVLMDNFEVNEIWDPGFERDNQFYTRFVEIAQEEAGERFYRPFEDQIVQNISQDTNDEEERRVVLGEPEIFGSVELIPLHSNNNLEGPNEAFQINNSSIVVKVVFGDNSILFTGDSNGRRPNSQPDEREEDGPFYTEQALLELDANHPQILRSTILKVPHHGSLTSSSEQFIERVQPQWAVISSGFRSNHRLPRPSTLARYSAEKINILRTDVLDDSNISGDDHIILIMGREQDALIWQQIGTSTLLDISFD